MSKALNEAKETLDSLIGDFVTGELVGERLRTNDKLVVSVKAHPKTSYKDYVRVIDQLKMADAKRISIANSN